MSYQTYQHQPVREENPYHDLVLASHDFWAGYTGLSERPPAPSYRMVRGKMRLGRYMDPYGCQGHMENSRDRWTKWYTTFFVFVGTGIVLGGAVDWILFFVALPILATYYFIVRYLHRRQYDMYWRIQEEIIRTGQPQWVPYDRERLKLLDREPLAVWP